MTESSVPWHLLVLALGILCALLLVTVAVLVTNISQYSQEKHKLEDPLNHHHNCSTMQIDIDLQKEFRRDKAIECSPGNDLLEFLNSEQNIWYRETKTDLGSSQHQGTGRKHWFCYGIKCYYFIKDRKPFSRCKQYCQNSSLTLLNIDNEDELKFLHLQVISDSYQIGMKYNKMDWAWIDNGPSKLDLNKRKYNVNYGGHIFLSKTRLDNIDCGNAYSCICGKRLDIYPD
eukprot:XP_017177367.1 PREDICTED: killer cell lectin-like receptor 5 [Mus musculus]